MAFGSTCNHRFLYRDKRHRMSDPDTMADAMKALSDPTRLRLLDLLKRQRYTKKHCVCGLGEQLGISQPNVSHHLKILKSAGFVNCAKKDGFSYYVVNTEKLGSLLEEMKTVFTRS